MWLKKKLSVTSSSWNKWPFVCVWACPCMGFHLWYCTLIFQPEVLVARKGIQNVHYQLSSVRVCNLNCGKFYQHAGQKSSIDEYQSPDVHKDEDGVGSHFSTLGLFQKEAPAPKVKSDFAFWEG